MATRRLMLAAALGLAGCLGGQGSYTLDVRVNGSGKTSPEAGKHAFVHGASVQVKAEPANGWVFTGWSGAVNGAQNPATVVMDADKLLTAAFAQGEEGTYTLEIQVDGDGSTNPPEGIRSYAAGSQVKVTATASNGATFNGWTGDATSNSSPVTITMNGNKTLVAHFSGSADRYTLSVAVSGSGTTSPAPGSYTYTPGAEVQVRATPASGATFTGWSGAATGTANPVTVKMDANKSLTATFSGSSPENYTLKINVSGSGSTDPSAGSHSYASGTQVKVTATASSEAKFDGWSGAASGTTNPVTITMDADKNLTAIFTGTSSEWKQCYGNGKMPDNPKLTVNPRNTGYKTAITNDGNSYVAMLIGPNRQSCLTDKVANFDVKDLTGEIKDVVEGLGFPPFDEWAKGYYLNWVVLNSGIPGKTLGGQGGHQGQDMAGNMDFESTEECPCNWGTGDNSNRGNALHESIHALQAQLWVFNNEASGWAHEAHNCYLGTMRTRVVYDKYTMGYGAAAVLQMPFVPIEAMGLLTDDSIGGPADQGAQGKSYVNSVTRYGLEIFFLSLNLSMGRGFVNCLWMEAPRNNRKSIFQVLQGYAGTEGAANAIMTFAARSSLLDFEGWTEVVRTTLKSNWNNGWWFYMFPGGDGTTTFSPPTKHIPHHQGRNIIPIKLASGAKSVTVEFTPDAKGSNGTAEQMRAQLTYRTTDDKPVFGPVFSSGQSTLELSNGARNGIVNLVVAVTNPNAASGSDDGSNKGFNGQEHFNYRARIVSGGTIAPTSTRPW